MQFLPPTMSESLISHPDRAAWFYSQMARERLSWKFFTPGAFSFLKDRWVFSPLSDLDCTYYRKRSLPLSLWPMRPPS